VTHGLFCREVVLDTEDRTAFEKLALEIREDLNPLGAIEEALVDRVVATLWRLRRLLAVEVGLFREEGLNCRDEEVAGRAFWCDSQKSDAFTKLARYESALDRELHRTLNQLERRQAMRLGQVVPPPIALDVTLNAEPSGPTAGAAALLDVLGG
jgi:hypothetical protein